MRRQIQNSTFKIETSDTGFNAENEMWNPGFKLKNDM
jgi:hypothetical protein